MEIRRNKWGGKRQQEKWRWEAGREGWDGGGETIRVRQGEDEESHRK